MPDVSVIIVTRNTCALTGAAIRSVLDSADNVSKEIIVVDNGSTDDTASSIPKSFPAVELILAGGNLGFAKANNLGAQKASGAFLLLLNSDAKLTPDALGTAVAWMRAHPECGITGAQLLNPDGSRQNSIANFPTLATELLNKSLLRRLFPQRFPGKEHPLSGPTPVQSVVGAFLLTRRDLWEAIGGFDERYFFFLEETDYCLQVKRRGATIVHLPQVRVWHGQGQSGRAMAAAVRIEYWRSRYVYFSKNHLPASRVVLRVGLALRLLLEWLGSLVVTSITLSSVPKWRERLKTQTTLMGWHFRGCPASWGIPR